MRGLEGRATGLGTYSAGRVRKVVMEGLWTGVQHHQGVWGVSPQ